MAKTARRSVTSNPSSLTQSLLQSNNHSIGTNSNNSNYIQKGHTGNSTSPANTIDPLRSSGHPQFTTTPAISNYSSHHGNHTTVRAFKNSSNSSNDNGSISISNNSTNSTSKNTTAADRLAAERERIRMEFYATYDVMTGVRIAATLGGFFGLMVFLIVYKSRSHSNETMKVLKDPKMAAVAAACMQEEEEREIQEALEATGLSLYPEDYDNMCFRRRQRMFSLGNVSAPPVLHRNFRFSSVGGGGYSSLLQAPRRFSYSGARRKSMSESSRILSAYPMGSSFGTDDYFIETDDELEEEYDAMNARKDASTGKPHYLLEVPITGSDSRRSSAMTCCSSESSYLERRCSALTLGLSPLPKKSRRSSSRRSSTDLWDYDYPDIQIINPTPKVSPFPSERDIHEKIRSETITTRADEYKPSTSYYNQYSRKLLRKGSFTQSDSIEEEPGTCREACGYSGAPSRSYADEHDVERGFRYQRADPTNNNHIHLSNNNISSLHSVQIENEDSSRRAPLASLSSFKISSIDYQDSDLKSLGSDSVFVESYADTDDDMEQFSTDSDEISLSMVAGRRKVDHQSRKRSIERQQSLSHKPSGSSHAMQIDSVKKLASTSKRTRPTLERHRTISSSSNDRIMLIPQQSQELPMHELAPDERLLGRWAGPGGRESFDQSEEGACGYSAPTSSRSSVGGIAGSYTTGSARHTDFQQPTTSFSYDNNNDSVSCSNSSVNKIKRFHKADTGGGPQRDHPKSKYSFSPKHSNSCENVEVNVIIKNRPTQATTTISPSVILELPVIALPSQANNDDDDDDDPPRDPSLPGTSRKWSKETLF